MRILHVTHDMNIGGTEQVIKQIVMGVDETRFASDIVCLDNTIGDVAKSIDPSRVKLHKLARRPGFDTTLIRDCLLYTSPSPRDGLLSRMPSSA